MTAPEAPAGPAAPAAPVVPNVVPTTAPAVPAPVPAVEAEPDAVDKLPKWAQKLINDTRSEAAKYRTANQTSEERQQAILKAAGIDTSEKDPAKIEAARQAREATSETERREALTELAVFKVASLPTVGADAHALLDSRSFLTAIKEVDPKDQTAVTAAIQQFVTDNPRYKTTAPRAGGVSGADFTGGTGGPTDLQSKIDAAYKAKDFHTVIALKQQLHSNT